MGELKMNDQVKDFIKNCYQIFRDKEEYDMDVKQVLSMMNEDDTVGYQAIAISSGDPDVIICIRENIQDRLSYQHIPEWDYNIDDYLLGDLEKGYEIEYMTIDEHCGIWKIIDCWRDEISHMKGLQKYMSYCQQNEINSHVISLYSSETIDISDMYQESNDPYSIIAKTSIGNRAVVLGHSPISPSPYVTWSTTSNRKRGYDAGHYFSNFTDAFRDYKERCQIILDKHLEFERNKTRPLKDRKKYER